jgi:hypothetical protein
LGGLPPYCILRPGETVFIPRNWYHATLNLGQTLAAGGQQPEVNAHAAHGGSNAGGVGTTGGGTSRSRNSGSGGGDGGGGDGGGGGGAGGGGSDGDGDGGGTSRSAVADTRDIDDDMDATSNQQFVQATQAISRAMAVGNADTAIRLLAMGEV